MRRDENQFIALGLANKSGFDCYRFWAMIDIPMRPATARRTVEEGADGTFGSRFSMLYAQSSMLNTRFEKLDLKPARVAAQLLQHLSQSGRRLRK